MVFGKLLGSSTFCQSECKNISCCSNDGRVYDPSRPPWMQPPPVDVLDLRGWPPVMPRKITDGSDDADLPRPRERLFAHKKLKLMTSIWVDSRLRVGGTDADFEFDIGQTVHLQGSAQLSVFKIRVADTFLSTDRGTYMYWRDTALGTLNWAQLPVGAYTGVRLAAWVSSNFASATYVEATNEITVAYDGNRVILNDQELRAEFPNAVDYPREPRPTRRRASTTWEAARSSPSCRRSPTRSTVGPLGPRHHRQDHLQPGRGPHHGEFHRREPPRAHARAHHAALPPLQVNRRKRSSGQPPWHQHQLLHLPGRQALSCSDDRNRLK